MGFLFRNKELVKQTGNDINTLNERVLEKLALLQINQETLQYIQEVKPLLLPYSKELAKKFYDRITSIEHLSNIINKYSSVERLKVTLVKYIEQFLQGIIDDEYINTRKKIGEVHSRINLTVDYFISAHQILLQEMITILKENNRFKKEKMLNAISAIQKVGVFDQQLIADVYMEVTFKNFLFEISNLLNQTTEINTTRQLITAMDYQMKETYSVTAATEEMSSSLQEVAAYTGKVADGTNDAFKSVSESKNIIDKTLQLIEEVGALYKEVIKKINKLSEEVTKTENVIHVIEDIANQTNLLALNASIEAARAGEQGKGFAVVADEVRNLSNHTKEHIEQISNNIKTLQEISIEVEKDINQTGELIDESVKVASVSELEINQIVKSMEEINQAISQIAAMVEEQTSTVGDISERNSSIFNIGKDSQNLAKQTAEIVYLLSKKIGDYRDSFFNINIKFQPIDILKVAKTDHLLWKWKIYNMILGFENIDINSVTSFENCKFGKWYYGDVDSKLKNNPIFKEIEEPHKAVHFYAKQAVELYLDGDILGAQKSLKNLEKESNTVVNLLGQLEVILEKND